MHLHQPSFAPPGTLPAPRRLWGLLAAVVVTGCGGPELDAAADVGFDQAYEEARVVAGQAPRAPDHTSQLLFAPHVADAIDLGNPLSSPAKDDWATPVALPSGGAPRHLPMPPVAEGPATGGDQAAPNAFATNFLVQRQEYGFWTHYLLQALDGTPLGVVERRHWRQPWRRCYEATDAAGLPLARGTQPWLSVGNVFTWHAVVRLEDAAGKRLGHLEGNLWTLRAASYDLYNAAGQKIAQAAVDDCGQGILVYAAGARRLVATMLREQQATRGSDRWNVRVEPDAPLAPEAWPLIAAFFADAWSSLARGCEEG